MDNNELLSAMSTMLDTKLKSALQSELQPLKDDMQNMKSDMQNMKLDMQNMKSDMQNMKSDMQNMNLRLKRIEVDLLENNVIPRLNTIEACYTSTFDRYKESVEGYEAMRLDIDVLKTVVAKHSEILKKI